MSEKTFLSPTSLPLQVMMCLLYCRCGKCRRYMKYIQARPCRLHCSSCDDTYTLPQNGNIKLYKELKCPLDDFELVLWTTGARGKVHTASPDLLYQCNFLSNDIL